jgi:hypothetical protein
VVGENDSGGISGDRSDPRLPCACCLMCKQTVLVRGDDQPVGNPKRKV